MPCQTGKQVKLSIDFQVLSLDEQVVESRTPVKDFNYCGTAAIRHFPMTIAPNQVDVPIGFGGLTQAKRIILKSSQPVTIKLQNITDDGFPLGIGSLTLAADPGITGIWITTGPNGAVIEATLVGE